ncbi:MAG: M14 family metallopeptidase [Bacteroidota bacterium]|nr:M14 family metallopeptidase [Bacteroidota bacterium]
MKRLLTILTTSHLLIFLIFVASVKSQNKYHSYDEMTKAISTTISSHKDIAKVESIGKTLEKRDIWAVTVGGKETDSKHAILVIGGAEADRLIGSELSVHFLNFLLDNYGKVDSITQLINSTTFYIIPRVNPDASEMFFQKPLYARTFNARPTDDDKDGVIDEDGYEDLNGDGLITMMRVKDNRGEWIPHPDDPRIMKKADPSKGEVGLFKLYTEGIDNDKDEQWNEDETGGVDFNKNFPHNYQFFGRGAGTHQISEAETRAVTNFCFSHPNITVVFTFSSNDNLMNPWKKELKQGGQSQTEQRQPRRRMMEDEEQAPRFITSVMDGDEQFFSYISKQYQEFTKLKSAPKSTTGEGAFNEWAYYHFGRWSFAANPWWIPEIESKKDTTAPDSIKQQKMKGKIPEDKSDEYADQIKALKWLDTNRIKDGFINWTKINHKDFPNNEVEVGGFKPYVLTNPPTDSIDVIVKKQNSFLAWLGTKLPKIEIRNVKVEPIDNKVFRVTADVVNIGYLPTNSAMGNKVRWPRDVKVTLDLSENQSLASGKAKMVLEPINGSGGRQEISWLIISKTGSSVTIIAESPMTGKATQTITLK